MDFVKICLTSLILVSQSLGQITRVPVTVYYEALCPFARKFITDQLYPTLQGNLSKYVDLELIPYGKAKTFNINGVYKFECDHGPNECYYNKIQACALLLINNGLNTPGLGYNKEALELINCIMDTINVYNNSLPNLIACASSTKIRNIGNIINCAESEHGSLYLAKLGNQTRSLQNPLGNVPSVVFSEEYKKEESDLAEKDFIKALCDKIQGEKPAECYRNGAQRLVTSNVGMLMIMIFTCYFY